MTDVWTSVGVIIGVAAVAITGWDPLDALIALAVAAEHRHRREALSPFERNGVRFHALRTRQAGSRAFVSLHVLVPGAWTVQRGHDVVEHVEAELRERMPYATVFTHLEPADDPRSFDDTTLDRASPNSS